MARALAATVLLACVATAVSAESTTIYQEVGLAPGWRTFSVDSTGTSVAVTVNVPSGADPRAAYVGAYLSDGTRWGSILHENAPTPISAEVAVGGERMGATFSEGRFAFPAEITLEIPHPGRVIFVTYGVGTEWSFTVEATRESQVSGVESGNGVFLLTRDDFSGRDAVDASLNAHGLTASAEPRTANISASGSLIGKFGYFSHPQAGAKFEIEGEGFHRDCPCAFEALVGEKRIGSGTYQFQFSGAQTREWPEVILHGADVRVASG